MTKLSGCHTPGPTDVWLFLDEHPDYIDDGDILYPTNPATGSLSEIPWFQHGGGSGITFCDGHAEIHLWTVVFFIASRLHTKIWRETAPLFPPTIRVWLGWHNIPR